MENIFFERPVEGVYERVEALNVALRERAVGATERTASRAGFGAVPQEVADRLVDPAFRGYEHRFTPFIAATAAFTLFCMANLWYLGGQPWLIVAVVKKRAVAIFAKFAQPRRIISPPVATDINKIVEGFRCSRKERVLAFTGGCLALHDFFRTRALLPISALINT